MLVTEKLSIPDPKDDKTRRLNDFLIIFGALLGLIFCYLVVIIFFPVLKVKPQKLNRIKKENNLIPDCRKDVEYDVDGEKLRSWLYLPKNSQEPVPCIVLSNGFGGTKDIVLEQYALRFVNAGFAAIALEYRHFGESDGNPRQLYSSIKQLEDIKATIKYARSLKEINPDKIFLWRTSAAGGYGINLAAEDNKITGVIAQCPGLDHQKDGKLVIKRESMRYFFKLIVHAQRDKGRSRFGLSPHMIPLVGLPHAMAMLNAPGALEGYSSLVHKSSLFKNKFCTRIMLMRQAENPIDKAKDVKCQVLLLICENDSLIAKDSHVKVAEILGEKATVKLYPIGHFDIYKGANFEKAVKNQISFIRNILT